MELDMSQYKRKAHFDYFRSLAYPYVGLTVDVDISEFIIRYRSIGAPFFLSFLWCVSQAANDIPEFRQRIVDDRIIEFDRCKTSHTVAKDDGTYAYCTLSSDMSLKEFVAYAAPLQEQVKNQGDIHEEKDEALSLFFISTLPWISYSHITQPVPVPADSNPRITWGKYKDFGEKRMLPVTVLCHHALVDGRHIADFFSKLQEYLESI